MKTILRLAGVSLQSGDDDDDDEGDDSIEGNDENDVNKGTGLHVDVKIVASRNAMMDVYTGEMLSQT